MQIVKTPSPVLLKKAEKISKIDQSVKKLIADMKTTLMNSDIGIGLAAPQVGVSLQLFLASPQLQTKRDKTTVPIYVFINPAIQTTEKGIKKEDDHMMEGCLSIPNVWGPVKRDHKVTLSFMDEDGKHRTRTYTGLMATIIQHEIDHLNGILFTSHVIEQEKSLYQVNPKTDRLEKINL